LHAGVKGVTDLITKPGLINLDFADIHTVMNEKGKAMMGTGEAEGENRAIKAAEAAISNPLLDHSSMKGARGVLINITGGMDMTLFEVDEAANRIKEEVDSNANIIFGSAFDANLEGKLRVSVVATGIDVFVPKTIANNLINTSGSISLSTATSSAINEREDEEQEQAKESQENIKATATIQKERIDEAVPNIITEHRQNLFSFASDEPKQKKSFNLLDIHKEMVKNEDDADDELGDDNQMNKQPQVNKSSSIFEIPTFLRNKKNL
jgi:cell division protein FtsZ